MRPLFRKGNLIAKRLIVGVVLFSTLLTLLTTSIQLYFDYHQSIEEINKNLHQIEVSSLPTIVNSVWVIDNDQIKTQLESLVKLQSIEYLEILVGDNIRWKAGIHKNTGVLERSFLLEYKHQDKMQNIGTLRVLADLAVCQYFVSCPSACILIESCVRERQCSYEYRLAIEYCHQLLSRAIL